MSEHISITTPVQGSPSHISWGSVIAGVVVSVAVLVTLSELCMAVGLGLLKPEDPTQDSHVPAIALGGAIAWVVSAILALFTGTWTTGHLARQRNETDTVLHGLVVWGTSIFIMLILGASAAGVAISGGFSLLRTGVQASGSAVGGMAHGAGSVVSGLMPHAESDMGRSSSSTSSAEPLFNWNSIKYSAENLLKQKNGSANGNTAQAGAPANGQAQAAPNSTTDGNTTNAQVSQQQQSNQGAQQQPQQATNSSNQNQAAGSNQGDRSDADQRRNGDPMALVGRLFSKPGEALQQSDKDDLVSMLTANTALSQADATKKVQEWEQSAQKAKQQYEELKTQAEQKARDLTAKTATALSDAAWLCFVVIVLGASASMLGAHFGGPRFTVTLHEAQVNREPARIPDAHSPI